MYLIINAIFLKEEEIILIISFHTLFLLNKNTVDSIYHSIMIESISRENIQPICFYKYPYILFQAS